MSNKTTLIDHALATVVCLGLLLPAVFPFSAQAQELKTNVAVFDLQNLGGLTDNEVQIITNRINTVVLQQGDFSVIEREQIKSILEEQGFQQSGICSDQACLVEAGQLLAVHKIISGSIGQMDRMYTVTLKIVNVTTARIEAQVARDAKVSKSSLLSTHIPQLTRELLEQARRAESAVSAEPEKRKPEKESMKSRSLFTRGYFWGGAIALAGGAVALGIVLSRSDDEDPVQTGGELPEPALPTHPDQ